MAYLMSMTFEALLELLWERVEHFCNAMLFLQTSRLQMKLCIGNSSCGRDDPSPSNAQL